VYISRASISGIWESRGTNILFIILVCLRYSQGRIENENFTVILSISIGPKDRCIIMSRQYKIKGEGEKG